MCHENTKKFKKNPSKICVFHAVRITVLKGAQQEGKKNEQQVVSSSQCTVQVTVC